MRTQVGTWGRSAAAAAVVAMHLGCGAGPARAPNQTRPLDERRAIEVIRRAVQAEGAQPVAGRDVELSASGKAIRIDVGLHGRQHGVAYITSADAASLGGAIPPPNAQDEKLRLVRAGPEGEVRIVLLYQDNYRYDDLVGESHEMTTITAERQLARDVQDFITHARTQRFP